YMADITALCPRVLLIHQGSLVYDGQLSGIVERFAPYREVAIELTDSAEADAFSSFGQVESVEGRFVRLIVRREDLTRTVGRLLGEFDVADLKVSDPPID